MHNIHPLWARLTPTIHDIVIQSKGTNTSQFLPMSIDDEFTVELIYNTGGEEILSFQIEVT